MNKIEVTDISVLDSGEIKVTPIINWNDSFQLIYRTATGVVWDEPSKSFMSPIPRDWSLLDWYKNIVESVTSEMGVLLVITQHTQWNNITKELETEIKNYASA